MNKNVLYVSYDGLTDSLGQSQILPYLIGLSQKGYNIHILSCEKKNAWLLEHKKISDITKHYNIKWDYVWYTKKPPVLSTIFDIFSLISRAKKISKTKKLFIVHCRSYIAAFVGVLLKSKYKIPFVFDMRGFYADERVDGNIWNKTKFPYSWIYNYFKKKEKDFLSIADYTISLTENGKQIIKKWNIKKDIGNKITVIPCCVDTELFHPSEILQNEVVDLRKELNINKSDFVLSYLGSIGTWYLLDEMLDFYKQLVNAKPNAKFLFITKEKSEFIKHKCQEKLINTNSVIIKSATREKVPLYLSLSTISLFFIKPVFSKQASSPTKLAELMSMGIPVICNAGVGDVDKIYENTNFGALVHEFSKKEYIRIITEMDEILKISSENIIKSAEQYFSLQFGVQKYYQVYKKIENN